VGDRFGGRGGQKDGLGLVAIPGEDGLTVMQDQGEVALLQGTEFKEKAIMFFEAEFLPLI